MPLSDEANRPLLEFAPDAVVISDCEGRITLVNRQTECLFGYNRSELQGQLVEILLPEAYRPSHVGQRNGYVASPRTRPMGEGRDLTGRRKDGAEFPVEISLSPLQVDANLFVIAFVRDVSERKRLEQERHSREMLRADQLMALGQVAAGIAHELRNPLTSIKGLVQVNLKEAQARELPQDDLRIIEHEVRRMERTLQTFLDFARPAQPHRERLDLVYVVERVLTLVAGRAERQGVSTTFTRSPTSIIVEADQDQVQQLLLNLVLNALDAMPSGGSLQISLGANAEGRVALELRDTGPGIAADLLPRIFEPFVSSKETGVGLGLAVSQQIAEGHGGQLTARNRQQGGACFTFVLPAIA